MTAPLPHSVILASAGSGKTFQLSSRYIGLLARGEPPERILATTFTRKAAGEILGRVLRRLTQAAADASCLDALNGHLEGVTLDGPRCRQLLAGLLRGIDRFHVVTLDAFFVQLAGLFGLELGLPAGWTVGEPHDDAALRAEAVSRVLAKAGRDELLALLRDLRQQQAARSVHDTMLRVASGMHAVWRESTPQAWDSVPLPAAVPEAELRAAIEALRALAPPATGKGAPNKHWGAALAKLVRCADAGTWGELPCSTLVAAAVAGEPTYSRGEITPAARAVLAVLQRHALHEIIAERARVGRANERLLCHFDAALAVRRRERRLYAFDDLPRALLTAATVGTAASVAGGPVSSSRLADGSTFHRLDGAIDHLLLDEFQDTSVLQWRALQPLVASVLASQDGRRTLFCVGDVKQSIYGWREGEPRLLAGLAARFPQLHARTLSVNYRSSQVVLDAVNATFGGLARSPVLADGPLAAAAGDFAAQFEQHTAHRPLPGSVTLREVAKEEDLLAAAAAQVVVLAQEAPQRTIGVLVRSNRAAARILYLLRDLGLRASGEGGNPLTDSEAVQLVLSLLHLADHPSDRAARFHVASSSLGARVGLPPDDSDERAAAADEAAARCAARVRRELLEQGYGRWLAALQTWVSDSPACDAWDRRRFAQLVDVGFEWEGRATLRPAAFVAMVRQRRVEDPMGARVVVMTVHAAKGLEFDAVVLPDLDGPLTGRLPPALLTDRPDPAGPITTVFPYVPQDIAPLHEPVARLFDAARRRRVLEELCVLYVAMTRARRRLDLLIRGPSPAELPCTPASLLRTGLDGHADEGGLLYHRETGIAWHADEGEQRHAPRLAAPAPSGTDRRVAAAPAAWAPAAGRRGLPRRAPSAREGGRQVTVARLLASGSREGRERGALFHRWFEQIEWLPDFTSSDEELVELGRRTAREQGLLLDDARLRAELDRFRAALGSPRVRGLLSPPATGGGGDARAGVVQEVWRERRFAVRVEDRERGPLLLHGVFDRVVLEREGGRVSAATVIDFKTDRVDGAGAVAARLEHYRPQMQEYRCALAALTGLAAQSIACRVLFVLADDVRDVVPEGGSERQGARRASPPEALEPRS